MDDKQLMRLRSLADSWRGSDARVSISRADARRIGLAADGEDAVSVPAGELVEAVDGLTDDADRTGKPADEAEKPKAEPKPKRSRRKKKGDGGAGETGDGQTESPPSDEKPAN